MKSLIFASRRITRQSKWIERLGKTSGIGPGRSRQMSPGIQRKGSRWSSFRPIWSFALQEEALEMDIYKLKTELDNAQMAQTNLKETISAKENDLRLLQERILDVSWFALSETHGCVVHLSRRCLVWNEDGEYGKGILYIERKTSATNERA